MSEFARSLAVVIGIDYYHHGIAPLQTAANDAREIAHILKREHNYDQVWLFLDQEATLPALQQLFEQTLVENVQPNDRLFFYFAGHGIALNGDEGPEGYLIPQDAKLGETTSYLPMPQLQAALSALPCRHFLGILDCCFAGAFRWSSTRDIGDVPEVLHKERYDRFIQDPAWQTITSAAYDQKALDSLAVNSERGQTGNHSPFATALIEALAGKADVYPPAAPGKPAGDGVITATELYLYLRDRVEPPTEALSHRQTPGIWPLKKHDKGEYIFLAPGHVLNLPPAPPLDESRNPYRGLQSFEAEQSDLFFGRSALTARLGEFVSHQPLTVVLGASGSGKSSLVKAGLIPDLKQRDAKAAQPQWLLLAPIRPGEAPFKALSNAFTQEPLSGFSVPEAGSASEVEMLSQYTAVWSQQHPGRKLLLAIDQFEELITLCRDEKEREQFLKGLAQAVTAYPDQLRLVLTLRSDFEPQFQDTALKDHWGTARFVVPPMTRSELREAIEEPASKRVMYFQSDDPKNPLIDQLINEVAEMPGALPLLSFTLSELYLKYLRRQKIAHDQGDSIDRAITEADYKELGGVARSLTQRADQEYEALVQRDPEYAKTIQNVMLRMVAVSGGELARRRVPLSEFEYPPAQNERVKAVIQRFVEARLLVEGQDTDGKPYAEPAHDALVRGWQKLLTWKQEHEENLILQRRLTPAAEEWKDVTAQTQSKSFLAKAEPVIDGLDRGFYAIERLLSKTGTRLVRLWKRSQQQQERSREQPGQFLWNTNPYLDILNQQLQSNNSWFNQVEAEFVQESVLQRRQNKSWRWRIAIGVILGLSGLTIAALVGQRQALISQIVADSESSEANLQSNQPTLDALVSSLRAGNALKHPLLQLVKPEQQIPDQAIRNLRKAVYTVKEYDRMKAPLSRVDSVFWGQNDQLIMTSTQQDGTVRVLDRQGKQLVELPGNQASVDQVVFSPDGSRLAIGTQNGMIRLWDWKNSQQPTELKGHEGRVRSLNFSPDGSKIFSVGLEDGIAKLWDLSSNQPQEFKGNIIAAGFRSDGQPLIVNTDQDHKIAYLWDTSGSKLGSFDAGVYIDGVSFSPDSKTLVLYAGGSTRIGVLTFLWQWEQKQNFEGDEAKSLGKDTVVSFSNDGQQVATTGSIDGVINLRDLWGTQLEELKAGQSSIIKLQYSPDGKHLLTASSDSTIRLWNSQTEQLGLSLLQPLQGSFMSVHFSSDGKRLVAVGKDGKVHLLDLFGKELEEFKGQYDPESVLSLSPNGRQLAITDKEHSAVRLVDSSGEEMMRFESKDYISRLGFSPDGNQLVFVSSDAQQSIIQLLNLSDKQGNTIKFKLDGTVESVNWSPDGKLFVAVRGGGSLGDQTLSFWHLLNNKEFQKVDSLPLRGTTREISDASFNYEDSLAVTADYSGGNIGLWDLSSDQEFVKFQAHSDRTRGVSLSPDSNLLVTVGDDGTAKLWQIGQLNQLLTKGCDLIRNYLQSNPNVSKRDRNLCH